MLKNVLARLPSISYRTTLRSFNTLSALAAKPLPPRPVIREEDIEENFLKGSGPGGQKINKTSSAVQLKHLPTGIVVKCQETRSRSQNRKIARTHLAEKLEVLEKGDESRLSIKAEVKRKKKSSASKKSRRKYRALEAGNAATEISDEEDAIDEDEAEQAEREELEPEVGSGEGRDTALR